MNKADRHNTKVLELISRGEAGIENLVLLGTDTVKLFPSLDSRKCAELLREEYIRTEG